MSTMKAAVYHGKGDVRVEQIPVPECGQPAHEAAYDHGPRVHLRRMLLL
jgi:hypothetical protein